MAYEAMSPLGISWGFLALLLFPLLLVASGVLAVVRRRELRSPRVGLRIAAAVAAGLWTFFTVGATVTVPVRGDQQGAHCLVNALGNNPERIVPWDTPCGRALARHLILSGGPSLLMLGVMVGATVRDPRLDRRTSRLASP